MISPIEIILDSALMLLLRGHSTITYRLEGVKGCIMEHSQRNVKKRYGGGGSKIEGYMQTRLARKKQDAPLCCLPATIGLFSALQSVWDAVK